MRSQFFLYTRFNAYPLNIFQHPCLVKRLPLILTKSAFVPFVFAMKSGLASFKYVEHALNAPPPSGIILSFPPFPNTRTKPMERWTSSTFKPISSLTRIPVPYSNSNNAISLFPCGLLLSGIDINLSTSATDKTWKEVFVRTSAFLNGR